MINVLAISITFIPSVLLCGHCQLDYLAKNNKINYKFVPEHFLNPEVVSWADVIVFIRSDSDMEAYVSKIAKKAGKKLIYVLDDDLLNPPTYISSYPYYSLPSTKKNMRTVMRNCDTFLTPSPVLMEKYGGPFKYKYLIVEPSLNRIDVKPLNKKIRIGFAGSIDRAQDINVILEDTIRKLVEKYGDSIDIEFMGAKPSFIEELNLKYLPYQDGYEAYTAFMAKCNWDIGLAPMPESPFHRCKYINKFVEYASFGIVGVYSNVEPYVYGIEDEVNGLLVNNNTNEWFNAICRLIEDKTLRNELSKECLRQAKDIYSLEMNSEDYLNKITTDLTIKEHTKFSSFKPMKTLFFAKRGFRKIKEQGKDFPKWLFKKLEEKKEIKNKNLLLASNTMKMKEIVNNNNSIFVVGEYPLFVRNEYDKRVKFVDDKLSKDNFLIYLNGEDHVIENINTSFLDNKHIAVSFNSYDDKQLKFVLDLIYESKKLLAHGVDKFIGEKMNPDFLKILNSKDVKIVLDTHGAIPEEYRSNMNYHAESAATAIEKKFYNCKSLFIVDNNELENHFKEKYSQITTLVLDNEEVEIFSN